MQLKDVRLVSLVSAIVLTFSVVNSTTNLPDYYKRQIAAVKPNVDRIQDYLLRGEGRGQTFDRLAFLGDEYGYRLTASAELERVIDYILQNLTLEGFTNVHGENVTVPNWSRGREYAELLEPRHHVMPMLGLGRSIGTIGFGNLSCNCTEAEAIVVRSFAHLDSLDNDTIAGKIVVYNAPWQGDYGSTNDYRQRAAEEAAKRGAVAAIIRSVTQFSIASPHTGVQRANVTIPGAAISIEDAEMLQRMYDRGDKLRIRLYMEAKTEGVAITRNIVAELRGTEFPNETIIVGGHIDAWDTGTGSMDDGGGCMIAWQTLTALKKLNLATRRTVRLVLWTAEEQGLLGGEQYFLAHQDEINSVSLIIESDGGAFKPRGIRFTGNTTAVLIMREIVETMTNTINATELVPGGGSSDTGWWVDRGVPGMELYSYNENYFWFHHTHGDTMTVLDRDDLDRCTTLWATIIYTVANLNSILPRQNCPELGPNICTDTPDVSASTRCTANLSWFSVMVMVALLCTLSELTRR